MSPAIGVPKPSLRGHSPTVLALCLVKVTTIVSCQRASSPRRRRLDGSETLGGVEGEPNECVLLGPGDQLSDVQSFRALEAIAVLRAKLHAVQTGQVSREQTHLYSWSVDVEPAQADPAQSLQFVVQRQVL